MEDKILKKVRGYYENAIGSSSYQKWQEEAKLAWQFYDGEQWNSEEKLSLAENGQPAIVINKIATKIDNVAGTEISGRTRILYRSRSGEKQEEKTAKALSDLALYVAEKNDQPIEVSSMFKEGLITGIAWLDTGVENAQEGVSLFNRHESSFDVIFDPNAKRMDYSDARFVCRERWLDEDDLKTFFPKNAAKMSELLNMQASHAGTFGKKVENHNYMNAEDRLFRVVEVQYKKTEKRYRVKGKTGSEFLTFEKETAYANHENTVTSEFAPRVYVAYFSENILLENKPLPYQHGKFTLIPYIFKRDKEDGRPYGIVRHAIDPQREFNKRRSKAMHLLNTAQVIADIDAVEDPNILAREAARPDGVILKRPGKELRIIRNADLAASQVSVMDNAAKDIQEVLGVFDEAIGKKSNATSGVAIQQRQMAGNMNQMFAFDALRRTKKELGLMVLSMIRQFFTSEMVIQITDDLSAPRVIHLNQPIEDGFGNTIKGDDGEILKVNDVRKGIFDVHVEEVRDVLSSRELELSQLNMLLQSGVPVPPQMLVEATTLRNKQEILESMNAQREIKGDS